MLVSEEHLLTYFRLHFSPHLMREVVMQDLEESISIHTPSKLKPRFVSPVILFPF